MPAWALANALAARETDVVVLTTERWRGVVERAGIPLVTWEPLELAHRAGDGIDPHASVLESARALVDPLRDLGADALVADTFAVPAALAAEAAGTRVATLIHDPYFVPARGLPLFADGLLPPRTPLGRAAWSAVWPLYGLVERRIRDRLDSMRAELGLGRAPGREGAISEGLAMLATLPQLEYPRPWPPGLRLTGPMLLDLAGPSTAEPPPGDEPLVVVLASSTGIRPASEFIELALDALARERVRVLASTSRRGETWPGTVPANAAIAGWIAVGEVLPEASLVITQGGHGAVVASLSHGVPVLVCPVGGNARQVGSRVAWSKAGLMLPDRLLGRRSLRAAVRRLLGDLSFAARARAIGEWARDNDGAARGAELVEAYARAGEADASTG
jgi:UDP:flavonoid glycosyltransferase YjiC (YdhE family)